MLAARKGGSELSAADEADWCDWLTYFSRYVSMHGFAWYDRLPNRITRLVLCVGFVMAFGILPAYLVRRPDHLPTTVQCSMLVNAARLFHHPDETFAHLPEKKKSYFNDVRV